MIEETNKAKNRFSVCSQDVTKFNSALAVELFPSSTSFPWPGLELLFQLSETIPAQETGEGQKFTVRIGDIPPVIGCLPGSPQKKEACGNGVLLGNRSPWGCAFIWAWWSEQYREKCLGYWSASNAEPDLGWDGCAALGCLISTWNEHFAVHIII